MRDGLLGVKILVATVLFTSAAVAGNHSNFETESQGHVCADAVRHKHPELHGKAWTAEWGKCRQNQAAYTSEK